MGMVEYIPSSEYIIDRFGRQMTYLRISVTDRCNMRCVYCMPPEGIPWQSHETILTYEEITKIVVTAARYGIREVRLTGGEPLLRKNLPDLVRLIGAIPGIEGISLTTNGLLLAEQAVELKNAGLKRVNISLDTLDADKFRRITRGGQLQKVLEGIFAAEAIGLTPIKINVVAMRGINEDELLGLARLSLVHPWQIRFIELMPLVDQPMVAEENLVYSPTGSYIPMVEIKQKLESLNLQPVEEGNGGGPARLYRSPGAPGHVGFISPISEHFCETCNRLRLTADGSLRTCLLKDVEVPIREAVRAGKDLLPFLKQAAFLKPEGHEISMDHLPGSRCMRQIGG
jgi:cyclic pyranopterin phosphate synthase